MVATTRRYTVQLCCRLAVYIIIICSASTQQNDMNNFVYGATVATTENTI